jgi:hypothetical protein
MRENDIPCVSWAQQPSEVARHGTTQLPGRSKEVADERGLATMSHLRSICMVSMCRIPVCSCHLSWCGDVW